VRGGRVTYLSDLVPAAAEERPFVEGLPFVWKWRADRDVLGKPLALGGVRYGRGLGVAAYTKLTYKLDGGYRRFKAAAGVCDSTAAGGHTLFRVLVDGREVFASKPLLGRGDKPLPVDVGVEKARELELVIDFGDESDLGDLGGWGDARLIR
jgi:alpha-galactosidase